MVVVRRRLGESQLGVERVRRAHARERIEAQGAIAEPARLVDHAFDQRAPDAPVAHPGLDVGVPDQRDILDRLHSHDADEPAAFLVALWALDDYREWSYLLSGDSFSTKRTPSSKNLVISS